jgi:hypothetical protein
MDLNKTSLIQKIISKGVVLTPFEAIQLRYLARKGILNDLINVEREANPYLAAERATGPISPVMVNFMVQQTRAESPDEYQEYNFAYESMLDQDSNSTKQAYKGLMLITQLRLIKAEFQAAPLSKTKGSLLDFDSYSYYHHGTKTFTQTLESLGDTFKYFIQDIDNILTLNCYLHELAELKDFQCLSLLKLWLSKPIKSHDRDFEYLNGAYLCCNSEMINLVLDRNHQNYVDGLERHVGHISIDFAENSLKYVKSVLGDITKADH